MEYEIVRSKRKSLAIEIKPDGRVVAKAPVGMSKFIINSFVRRKEAWIRSKQAEVLQRAGEADSSKFSSEELSRLKADAKKLIVPLADEYANIIGVNYGRISFRCQKTRWGSCSSKGNLNFNILLAGCPREVLVYVVVHELCHRKYMNHSKQFWAEVGKYVPGYKEYRLWLKKNGSTLIARLP